MKEDSWIILGGRYRLQCIFESSERWWRVFYPPFGIFTVYGCVWYTMLLNIQDPHWSRLRKILEEDGIEIRSSREILFKIHALLKQIGKSYYLNWDFVTQPKTQLVVSMCFFIRFIPAWERLFDSTNNFHIGCGGIQQKTLDRWTNTKPSLRSETSIYPRKTISKLLHPRNPMTLSAKSPGFLFAIFFRTF